MNTLGTKANIVKKVIGILVVGFLCSYCLAQGNIWAAAGFATIQAWLGLELFVSIRRYRRNHAEA